MLYVLSPFPLKIAIDFVDVREADARSAPSDDHIQEIAHRYSAFPRCLYPSVEEFGETSPDDSVFRHVRKGTRI